MTHFHTLSKTNMIDKYVTDIWRWRCLWMRQTAGVVSVRHGWGALVKYCLNRNLSGSNPLPQRLRVQSLWHRAQWADKHTGGLSSFTDPNHTHTHTHLKLQKIKVESMPLILAATFMAEIKPTQEVPLISLRAFAVPVLSLRTSVHQWMYKKSSKVGGGKKNYRNKVELQFQKSNTRNM